MYVREDSIIPLGPVMNHVGQKEEEITLWANVQDEANFDYRGDWEEIHFECEKTDEGIELRADKPGKYTVRSGDFEEEFEIEEDDL